MKLEAIDIELCVAGDSGYIDPSDMTDLDAYILYSLHLLPVYKEADQKQRKIGLEYIDSLNL